MRMKALEHKAMLGGGCFTVVLVKAQTSSQAKKNAETMVCSRYQQLYNLY